MVLYSIATPAHPVPSHPATVACVDAPVVVMFSITAPGEPAAPLDVCVAGTDTSPGFCQP